ncbi:MAG TPA: SDR family NAD(P)-dependent oxidoreductase [Acidimicrobiales bacterium]|nr:SDR family NAD(P)-dependent oxidoreductase [Acidimicrobiales bacterium]
MDSRIAVVTGGSRGIGAATVHRLATLGWDVCLSLRERDAEATEVVARCRGLGRRAFAVRADVSVEADVVELFARVDRDLGTVTTLVNNAGMVASKSRVDEMGAERVSQMLSVNVVGAFTSARSTR